MATTRRIEPFPESTDRIAYQIAGVTPHLQQIAKGVYLFRRGKKPREIFRLLTGRLRLLRITELGAEVVMHEARAGEFFAEASLFSERYHCDAVALDDSVVLSFPKAELVTKFTQDPQALWEFTAMLAKRVQAVRTNLALRQIRSATERVMQAIRLRCDDNGSWTPDGTLKQFADEVGLTHEALYRALSELERRRQIARSGAEISLVEATRSK